MGSTFFTEMKNNNFNCEYENIPQTEKTISFF